MKNTVFTGAATAIITPLTESGIDYARFGAFIDWQIAQGIDAIVAVGTTGEGSTLSDREHRAALQFCVERVAGRVPVIAGTGSNDIAYAVDLTRFACAIGADAMLLVTPYYNKATQGGLAASFRTIADASTKPCILYNVPSRTGIGISAETYKALSRHPNIVGVKEASGNLSLVGEIVCCCGDDLYIWSGNDDNTVPMMAMGALGVISVASNIVPGVVAKLCQLCLDENFKDATELYAKYAKLFSALFIETNPIPVKAAMKMLGMDSGILRLPLTSMSDEHFAYLRNTMSEAGLNV